MTGPRALPAWVVPSAMEVSELFSLARSEYDAPHGNRPQACGIVGALRWVLGETMIGPVTARPDQPVTETVATAECWAAKALAEGDRSSQDQLEAACAELGVDYWPPDMELIDPEEGHGVYQTLSWLLAWSDGYRGGCAPPLPHPPHPQSSLPPVPQQRSPVHERNTTPSASQTADG
jgi:hypothetical protein